MTDSGKRPSFRVAIFGLGVAAERIHLPACVSLPGVEVTSACEPDATRREQVGRRFGVPISTRTRRASSPASART